ncbi:hypothetical protein ACC705_06815 [Rhizobium ruizarguesonis]
MSAASSTIYLVLREGDLADLLDRQRAGRQVVVWNDVGCPGSIVSIVKAWRRRIKGEG